MIPTTTSRSADTYHRAAAYIVMAYIVMAYILMACQGLRGYLPPGGVKLRHKHLRSQEIHPFTAA